MKHHILTILVLLVISLDLRGAFNVPDFNFIHYSTENGLPSNNVRDIVQDKDGFMWFATDGGLVRYDGTIYRTFIPGDADNPDIFVMSVCSFGDGLLVGTDHALYLYSPVSESLRKIPIFDKTGKEVSGSVVNVAIDSNRDIWVSVETKGVFRLNQKGERIDSYEFPEVENYISMIYVDGNDIVWVVNSGKLFRFDRGRRRFELLDISVSGMSVDPKMEAITCDSRGDYWLGSWEHGLFKFNGRTGVAQPLSTLPAADVWHIHSIMEFSPTMLMIGSDSGLTLVDVTTGEYRLFQSDELNRQSLSDRFVYPLVRDMDGGIWIGTYYRGVNYLSRDSRRFSRWSHSRFSNSVSGNVVSRFCEDEKGNIWIGTADGGLCRYNPETGLFISVPLGINQQNENVNALCCDDSRMWVGTYASGAGYIDVTTGNWHPVSVEGNYNYSSYAICMDSKGDIWMASTSTLTKFDREKGIFRKIDNFGAWITDIDEDPDGSLWLSTQGQGLFRLNPDTGEKVDYQASKAEGSLPHNHINSVTVDDTGTVYVATIFGVYSYDRGKDCFNPVGIGIKNLSAQSIEKSGNDLWIATLSGLVRLFPCGEARVFTYADGISDNQFVPGASLHASDGRIYYGSVHGFCCVDPKETGDISGAPVLKFTGLEIINNMVLPGDERLPQSLNHIDELQLTHADHTFSIYFSALSYSNPWCNRYRYRLEGFDKAWHETDRENRASYSNLPPGKYTLRVLGANSDGGWGEEGISLRIVVKPAWYASTLMKALYVILGLVALLLLVRLILHRIQRNHIRELDRISSNNEKEMFRSKLKFFTVVAHEIRTPVSLIIGPLEKILNSSEKFSSSVTEDLKVIDRNAHRLLSLVNQLLDFKKVEDNALPVGFRSERITPLIENVTDRFRPSLEQKGISLSVTCPDSDVRVDVDPEAVTKLVSNLLNNARKFTKNRIDVDCHLLPDGEHFEISVGDNGIGISKENRDKIFKPFFQVLDNVNDAKGGTGLGLSIVKSVADAHGGGIEVESAPGKGSRFIATLPVHQKDVIPYEDGSRQDYEMTEEPDVQVGNRRGDRPVLLVVDDNEEMLRFLVSSFEAGYEVVTALNGKDALEKMAQKRVSFIICDWMMPVMDGVEFLRMIRENEDYCHIPFVMLTAKTDNLSKIETMKNGADFYLEKPFSTAYLRACVDNLIDMRSKLIRKFSNSPLEPITALAQTNIDAEILTKLQRIIEENMANPELNVDFLVNHMGMSRSGLYAKIKTLADVTPNELIQITRLKKAAVLLKEGKYRINEISYMVGFNSSSYFSRCFQKQFGIKPGEFA